MLMSICIPTYEMMGLGAEFLSHQFNIFLSQTIQNFEVVISDHSENEDIEKICFKWKKLTEKNNRFKINYIRNFEKRGNSSANINNAIKYAKTNIIKPLFQDDYLLLKNSLEIMYKCFKDKNGWAVVGSSHSLFDGNIDNLKNTNLFNTIIPKYNENIYLGNNTISSPSVLIMKLPTLDFDENLIWLMDVDLYKRLYDNNGLPTIIPECLVVNRIWENQLSKIIDEKIKDEELNYVKEKFKWK